jgi:hypothetical protein
MRNTNDQKFAEKTAYVITTTGLCADRPILGKHTEYIYVEQTTASSSKNPNYAQKPKQLAAHLLTTCRNKQWALASSGA